MVSREHKIDSQHDKLQLLRSITHSHAINETSIIVDASNYIKELKQKVESLNKDIASASDLNSLPQVTVEILEKGFLVNVYSAKNCSGLLVFLLEAFEELGLDVLEARVSCQDRFHLQAFGGENEEDEENYINAQMVQQAISEAIKNWHGSNEKD
ncbi:transcription factor SCREAM2-like [Olea europaea var. sylvestris]|uniref:transcription factor SCREAM2-like n=1 Tax=Olea europaea var. sylvestris TaxID=158386 RepID=UPI000C1D2F2B|nr:transcription factor SCREAM2-like [Olea europaea var. sylvestris]XP_022859543.1 transcription factor SCREAM2-like [Olea europaea var. sylvestris]XP_022859544.1 transcription factor SCREAM2-like [Olea europaea var. sylvestris]